MKIKRKKCCINHPSRLANTYNATNPAPMFSNFKPFTRLLRQANYLNPLIHNIYPTKHEAKVKDIRLILCEQEKVKEEEKKKNSHV